MLALLRRNYLQLKCYIDNRHLDLQGDWSVRDAVKLNKDIVNYIN